MFWTRPEIRIECDVARLELTAVSLRFELALPHSTVAFTISSLLQLMVADWLVVVFCRLLITGGVVSIVWSVVKL